MSPNRLQPIFDIFRHSKYTNPQDIQTLESLYNLCVKIKDTYTIHSHPEVFTQISNINTFPSNPFFRNQTDLSFITPTSRSELSEPILICPLKITLQSTDWSSIIQGLQDNVLSCTQSKSKKKFLQADPYQSSIRPANLVHFNVRNTSFDQFEQEFNVQSPHSDTSVKITEISEEVNSEIKSAPEDEDQNPETSSPLLETEKPPELPIEIETNDNFELESDNDISTKPNEDITSAKDMVENPTIEKEKSPSMSQEISTTSPADGSTPTDLAARKRRKSDLNTQEPMKSRSSKRFKSRNDEKSGLDSVDFIEDEPFFENISGFLKNCNLSFGSICHVFSTSASHNAPDVVIMDDTSVNDKDAKELPQCVVDFKDELVQWGAPQTEIFATIKTEIVAQNSQNSSDTFAQPILAQLIDESSASNTSPESSRPTSLPSSIQSLNFVKIVNLNEYHVQEVRINLVRTIFGVQNSQDFSKKSPILIEVWPISTIKSLASLVQHLEEPLQDISKSIVNQLAAFSSSPLSESSNTDELYIFSMFNEITMVQTILELIANQLLNVSKNLRKTETLTKTNVKDYEAKKALLKSRYISWRRIFNDLATFMLPCLTSSNNDTDDNIHFSDIILRHHWSNVLVGKTSFDMSTDDSGDFSEIIREFENQSKAKNNNSTLEIICPNFTNIPPLSLDSIKNQLSRFRAMKTLSEIFKVPVIENLTDTNTLESYPKETGADADKIQEKGKDSNKSDNNSKNDKTGKQVKLKPKTKQEKEKEREERLRQEKEAERLKKESEDARIKLEEETKIKTSKNRIQLLEKILLKSNEQSVESTASDPLSLSKSFSCDPANNSSLQTSAHGSQITSSDSSKFPVPEQEFSSISQYLSKAPLDLRLRFWNLLLSDYKLLGERDSSVNGYLSVICEMVAEIQSDHYNSLSQDRRSVFLLRTIYMCYEVTKNMMSLNLTFQDFESIGQEKLHDSLAAVIIILRVMCVFVLFEDCIMNDVIPAPKNPAWPKSTKIMKELIVRCWCLFYYLFYWLVPKNEKTPETLNDLLSIVHEHLGTRGFCGAADGVLLDMSLKELQRIKFSESQADIIQCLNCRYKIVISTEEFYPFEHNVEPIDMDRTTALNFLEFAMSTILKRKNLAQSIMRAEVKGVMDEMYEAIKFPTSKTSLSRNAFILKHDIVDIKVNINFLQKCFEGGYHINFIHTASDVDVLSRTGFYYMLGQIKMHLFRIRKKTLPGHTEDITEAIKFLKYDLMCGNYNRFETWYALAQGYDSLAEDDLTWNVDKITDSEARQSTISKQKKALIYGGLAINRLLQAGSSELFANTTYQNLNQTIWIFFARLLFNASQCPLEMDAFDKIPEKILCGEEGLYSHQSTYQIKPSAVIKSALLALKVAENEQPDWFVYYLKGQILHKLKRPSARKVLDTYLLSMAYLFKKQSHNDVVVEPHYKLVSCLYRYFRAGTIEKQTAMEYIQKSVHYDTKVEISSTDDPENNDFYSACISTLAKIRSSDKKKWHHRPTYRMAKIYEQVAGDIDKAKEEMSAFFLLKPTSKVPIQIWKTEYERPGQHFEYIRKYIMYYIELLEKTRDLEVFGYLAKCMRKFRSGMLGHQETWEHMCTTIAHTLKEILHIPPKFTDIKIQNTPHDVFLLNTNRLLEYSENPETSLHPIIKFLNYTAEIRRLNNGFGSTAALDDAFVSIFLLIHQDFTRIFNLNKKKLIDEQQKTGLTDNSHTNGESFKPSNTSSTKISVLDLLSDPVVPSSVIFPNPVQDTIASVQPSLTTSLSNENSSTPANSKAKGNPSQVPRNNGSAVKTRVTRREIISKSLALLRVTLTKLISTETHKLTKGNTFSSSTTEAQDWKVEDFVYQEGIIDLNAGLETLTTTSANSANDLPKEASSSKSNSNNSKGNAIPTEKETSESNSVTEVKKLSKPASTSSNGDAQSEGTASSQKAPMSKLIQKSNTPKPTSSGDKAVEEGEALNGTATLSHQPSISSSLRNSLDLNNGQPDPKVTSELSSDIKTENDTLKTTAISTKSNTLITGTNNDSGSNNVEKEKKTRRKKPTATATAINLSKPDGTNSNETIVLTPLSSTATDENSDKAGAPVKKERKRKPKKPSAVSQQKQSAKAGETGDSKNDNNKELSKPNDSTPRIKTNNISDLLIENVDDLQSNNLVSMAPAKSSLETSSMQDSLTTPAVAATKRKAISNENTASEPKKRRKRKTKDTLTTGIITIKDNDGTINTSIQPLNTSEKLSSQLNNKLLSSSTDSGSTINKVTSEAPSDIGDSTILSSTSSPAVLPESLVTKHKSSDLTLLMNPTDSDEERRSSAILTTTTITTISSNSPSNVDNAINHGNSSVAESHSNSLLNVDGDENGSDSSSIEEIGVAVASSSNALEDTQNSNQKKTGRNSHWFNTIFG